MANRPVTGNVAVFDVRDENYATDNSWVFFVQVPDQEADDKNIIVRPEVGPSREDLVEVERRAITFLPTNMPAYQGQVYNKVALADPTGQKTKIGVRFDARDCLPSWMAGFQTRMHKKSEVKTTRGTDGNALVVLLKQEAYSEMIRLFMCTRAWPLLVKRPRN